MSSETQAKFLETFPTWLRALGEDAEKVAGVVGEPATPDAAREALAGGLNYLFKSLDLIPDGIDDIGYLDDAFVLRMAAGIAADEDLANVPADKMQDIGALANDCDVIKEFLGDDLNHRLLTYTQGLKRGAARGRTVSDILADEGVRREFISDVEDFARTYEAPGFAPEEKNLIKLRAFFDAKLPK